MMREVTPFTVSLLGLTEVLSCVLSSTASEVCFEGLGCFAAGPPWGGTDQRPVSILPSHPDEIGTRFLLFTQRNRYYQARSVIKSLEPPNRSFCALTQIKGSTHTDIWYLII